MVSRTEHPLSHTARAWLKQQLDEIATAAAQQLHLAAHLLLPNAHRAKLVKFRPQTIEELLQLNVSRLERHDFNENILDLIDTAEQMDTSSVYNDSLDPESESDDQNVSSSDEDDSDEDPIGSEVPEFYLEQP